MPTYSYQCSHCNEQTTAVRRISERKTNAPLCCDTQMNQIITAMTAPMVNDVSARHFDNYECPVTGNIVTSQKQKREIEARNDLVRIEPGMNKKRKKHDVPDLPDELKPEMKRQIAMQKAMAQ